MSETDDNPTESSNKAWAKFEIKSIDDDKRIIKGVASTITPDRDEDIVRPKGGRFTLPFPFLEQHNHDRPIGHVIDATATDKKLSVTVQIVKDSGLPYVEHAWKKIKAKLLGGLSIGFRGIKVANIEGTNWGRDYIEWDLLELSAVTVPANEECTITSIKQFDSSKAVDDPVGDSAEKSVASSDAWIETAEKHPSVIKANQAILAVNRLMRKSK